MAVKERNKAVPAVYVILRKEDVILIARRCNTGYQDGNYNLPSGHVEDGETPIDAMVREVKEEIGVEIRKDDLHFAHVSYRLAHDETGQRADYFFWADKWSGEVINAEPHKCDDLKWVRPEDLPANMTPHVRAIIGYFQNGVIYSEFGQTGLEKLGYR